MTKVNLVYLASPYTDDNEQVMEERYRQVLALASKLSSESQVVFSPVVYGHHMYPFLPANDPTVAAMAREMILRCDDFIIYRLPGWDKSKGIKWEAKIAADAAKNIGWIPFGDEETDIKMGRVMLDSYWRNNETGHVIRIVGDAQGMSASLLPWNCNWEVLGAFVVPPSGETVGLSVAKLKAEWTATTEQEALGRDCHVGSKSEREGVVDHHRQGDGGPD